MQRVSIAEPKGFAQGQFDIRERVPVRDWTVCVCRGVVLVVD